jgi:hypothetical protein
MPSKEGIKHLQDVLLGNQHQARVGCLHIEGFSHRYTDRLEYLVQSIPMAARHFLFPHTVLYALGSRQQTEVWTGFCLQPLEVVNLVPLVCRLCHGGRDLCVRISSLRFAFKRVYGIQTPTRERERERERGTGWDGTYIGVWQGRKPDVLAVLDDRPARAVQVHVDVLRAVHAELPARDDDDAVLDARDVRRARDVPAHNQAARNVLQVQGCEGRAVCRRQRQVDDAAPHVRDGARARGVRGRRRQDDVDVLVVRQRDLRRAREGGLADAAACVVDAICWGGVGVGLFVLGREAVERRGCERRVCVGCVGCEGWRAELLRLGEFGGVGEGDCRCVFACLELELSGRVERVAGRLQLFREGFDGLRGSGYVTASYIDVAGAHFAVGSLVVGGDVACRILDFVGETVDACETMVDGVVALAPVGRYAVQTINLLCEGYLGQLSWNLGPLRGLPVTSLRNCRKKRSFVSASVCAWVVVIFACE